jgi:hypothetical protein
MQRHGRALVVVLVALGALNGLRSPALASTSLVGPPQVTVGDSDGDGMTEASVSGVAGGPCACRCPLMGGEAGVAAAGQAVTTGSRSALVVCGTRTGLSADPDTPDPTGGPRVSSRLRYNPGGLGRGGPAG